VLNWGLVEMNIDERLKKVICGLIIDNDESIKDTINDGTDLVADLHFNSISFVKLVIELEKEFEFDFDDEYLNYNTLYSFGKIKEYLLENIDIN
jgi:acyl carrier protein